MRPPISCPSIYSQSDWFNSTWYISVILFVCNLLSSTCKAAVSLCLRRRMWWGKWIRLQQISHHVLRGQQSCTELKHPDKIALPWHCESERVWQHHQESAGVSGKWRHDNVPNHHWLVCRRMSCPYLPYTSHHLIKCINYPTYPYIM